MLTKEELTARAKFRVKIKSLAIEASIIRNEEKKAKFEYTRNNLYHHRIDIVRREQRYTLLAYSYYRKKKYSETETRAKVKPKIQTINRVLKSLTGKAAEDLDTWLTV